MFRGNLSLFGSKSGLSKAGKVKGRGRPIREAASTVVEPLEERRMMSISTIHSFVGTDGNTPSGGLVQDSSGNLFGVTLSQGATSQTGDGVIYEMKKGVGGAFTYTKLYTFPLNGSNGSQPSGRMVFDGSGNLYGTTITAGTVTTAGDGYGTIWEMPAAQITAPTPAITVLHTFNGSDGNSPFYGLTISGGNLYGTTQYGNTHFLSSVPDSGGGGVFEYSPSTSTFAVISSLDRAVDGRPFPADVGGNPSSGAVLDSSGNIYFSTVNDDTGNADGAIYKLSGGSQHSIYDFSANLSNGFNPEGNLTVAPSGIIYGTTTFGGTNYVPLGTNNFGTIFKICSGTVTPNIASFENRGGTFATNGSNPSGGLAVDSSGNLYGVTRNGGSSFQGNVFKYTVSTGALTDAGSFTGFSTPIDEDLVIDSSGNIFGTTPVGGASGYGSIFEI